MTDDEAFDSLVQNELFKEDYETVVIPNWFKVFLCYALPALWLVPVGRDAGGMLGPFIFTALIGSALCYYFHHTGIINSFTRQEKPLKGVFNEYKEKEGQQVEFARKNSPDSQLGLTTDLSDFEEAHWNELISSLNPTTTQIPDKKKRWGWKKSS